MTARTDIAPPLARIAIAIADYLIHLTDAQRDEVIARALCVVEDGEPAADTSIPYVVTERQSPVAACDEEPEPMLADEPTGSARPSPRRVSALRQAATAEIEAAARSIVEVLSGHSNGLTKGQLASALTMDVAGHRFLAALRHVVNSGRIRAQGNTNSRRYFPAGK